MRNFLRSAFWSVTVVYWITIFIVTHIPLPPPQGPTISDKTIHGIAYLLLGSLLFISGCFLSTRRWTIAGWVIGICLVYGAIDEVLQGFVNRSPELGDWLADASGALLGVSLCLAAHAIAARRSPREPVP